MPLHPHLDGVALDIAYRASDAPQIVDVRVALDGEAAVPLGPWAISSLVRCVNRGLAGGADFAPWAGAAKIEAGPTGEGEPAPGELGPTWAWRLSLAGVSSRFLRVLVENLAASGRPSRVRSISIVGTLPPDGSPLSARDRDVAAWLEDADAYPGAWSNPGFAVSTRSIPRGATMRVTLAGKTTDEVGGELEELFSAWQDAVLTYPNAARTTRGVMDPHATFARSRVEVFAKVGLFDHAREAPRAALLNALARFHATTAKIAQVEIAMP